MALSILIPLARLLGPRVGLGSRVTASPLSPNGQHKIWDRCRAVLSVSMPVAGAILAVVFSTATSCGPDSAVTRVATDGGLFYAFVDQGWGDPQWALSGDGGRTWQPSDAPTGYPPPRARPDPFEDPGPAGPTKVCASDGTCWRVRDQRVIERRSPDGDWIEEFRLSEEEFSAISTGCAGGHVGVLGSIAWADRPAGPHVLVSLGAKGVLIRYTDGRWERTRVLSAPPIEASLLESAASRLVLLFGPILFIAMWLIGRRRWPSWRAGLVAVAFGWCLSFLAAGAAVVLAGGITNPERLIGPVEMFVMVVTSVVAVAIARRARQMPPGALPAVPIPRRPDIG